MNEKPKSPSQPTGQSGRPRASQRRGRRTPARNSRNRQLLAVGALVLFLAVIAGIVVLIQQNPTSSGSGPVTGSLPNEQNGRSRGSATASVVLTEWSDYQ